ncbi:DUF3307 domain-containing protein [Aerococcus viridans]|uniref:DUF3307 domain-containing protein n=1 Tax=Aerococcus viridans TaxID=1377 RepID=UPI0039B01739
MTLIHNSITLVLLIAHFLGDYHFQSEKLSEAKGKSHAALARHLAIHGLLLFISWLLTWQSNMILLFSAVWLGHIIIDLLKVTLQRKWIFQAEPIPYIYLIDQLLHISLIVVLSQVVFPASGDVSVSIPTLVLKWTLLTVLITKPANVTFKVLFSQYQNYTDDKVDQTEIVTVPGAGAMIGILERILSAIFLSLNALSSIGLIYTAKSIARFKLIEENQGFAEYYLIGTLFSILFVVVSYFFIF